jgi:hypothetical protein
MVGKFGPSDVLIATEEEENELSYHLYAIDESSNNEAEATIKLLNMARTFQIEFPTTSNCPPSSPMPCYYVEMGNSSSTIVNNHEEDYLVVDLEDVTL